MKADVILCGSCVVDLPCLTVPLNQAIGADRTIAIEPITPLCGGITCNVGIALQRLGVSAGVLSCVGADQWAEVIRRKLSGEGVDSSWLHEHPTDPTTVVTVLIDKAGNRSFLVPDVRTATKSIDAAFVEQHLDAFHHTKYTIFGYFGRMPKLEPELSQLLPKIRARGCKVVIDTAETGGDWLILQEILPYLDVFVPSRVEAASLTNRQDPRDMVRAFRDAGAPGVLGVKLGEKGALLQDADGSWIDLPAVEPPGPVIDTTGAGDCFVAGLLAGLHRGWDLERSGCLATAAGAFAVTARGGCSGISSIEALLRIVPM